MGLVVESCATGMIVDECIQPLQPCRGARKFNMHYKIRCTERGVLCSVTNNHGDYSSNNGKWGRRVGEAGVVIV